MTAAAPTTEPATSARAAAPRAIVERRGRRRSAWLAGLLLAAVVSTGGVAAAHGGAGSMTLVSYTPNGSSAQVVVQVTFTGDGHPVDEATVTVAGENATGAALTPVALQPNGTPGQFAGTVEYPAPGEWSLRVTSVEPTTSLTLNETVELPQVTVESPGLLTGEDPATTAPDASVAPAPVISPAPDQAGDDSSGSMPTWVWIVAVAAAVVSVVIGVAFVMNGSKQGPID